MTALQGLDELLPLLTGLFSAGHCVGMCGGVIAAYSMGSAQSLGIGSTKRSAFHPSRLLPHLLYNGGRIAIYTVLGGLFGALGKLEIWFAPHTKIGGGIHLFFAVVMLAYGLSALGVPSLQNLTRPRSSAWLTERVGPIIRQISTLRPLLLGLISGFLPCSLLIAMQIQAIASGSITAGMTILGLFGIGTALPLFSLGLLTTNLTAISRYRLFQIAGLLILIMAFREFNIFIVLFFNSSWP